MADGDRAVALLATRALTSAIEKMLQCWLREGQGQSGLGLPETPSKPIGARI